MASRVAVWKERHPSTIMRLRSLMLHRMEYGWILGIVQGLIFIFVTYLMGVPPASGIAVATLGLLAIVMAIRAEDKWELPEKVTWLVIATCMMMVEYRQSLMTEASRTKITSRT